MPDFYLLPTISSTAFVKRPLLISRLKFSAGPQQNKIDVTRRNILPSRRRRVKSKNMKATVFSMACKQQKMLDITGEFFYDVLLFFFFVNKKKIMFQIKTLKIKQN